MLVLALYAGSGKSTTVWDVLMEMKPRFIYLPPRHNVIEDMCEFDPRCTIVLDGDDVRTGSVPHVYSKTYKKKSGQYVCQVLNEREDLAGLVAAGKITSDYFCNKDCVHYVECSVNQAQWASEKTSWCGVHAHMINYLENHFEKVGRDKYNVVVIDENPFNTMYQDRDFSLDELDVIKDFVDDKEIAKVISSAKHMFINEPTEPNIISFSTKKFLKNYNETIRVAVEEGRQIPSYNNVSIIAKVTELVSKGRLFSELSMPSKVFDKGKNVTKVKIGYYDKDMLNRIGIPIIALDATGIGSTWHRIADQYEIVGGKPYIEEWRHSNIVKIIGSGNFYHTSWNHFKPDNIAFTAMKLMSGNTDKKVIVCCSKAIMKIIKDNTPGIDNIKYAHFMSLTSDNSFWKDANVLVIAGRPTLPPSQRAGIIKISGLTEDDIDYIKTESEIVQGIGRLRQNLEYTKDIPKLGGLINEKHRGELFIVIFPHLKTNNPFDHMEYYDADSYTQITMEDYVACLKHGYMHPIDYYCDVVDRFLISPHTESVIYREFNNAKWVPQVMTRLEKEGRIKLVNKEYARV
jgi:hypothetical protein